MPVLIAIGVVLAALAVAWTGVEVNHLIHAYPGQFYMGAFAFLFIIIAAAGARFRASTRQVPLRPGPPAMPRAIKAAPVLDAIKAPPAPPAVAAPLTAVVPEAPCEGPGCPRLAGEDPWTAQVGGEEAEHLFCSQECAEAWRGANHAA